MVPVGEVDRNIPNELQRYMANRAHSQRTIVIAARLTPGPSRVPMRRCTRSSKPPRFAWRPEGGLMRAADDPMALDPLGPMSPIADATRRRIRWR